ncbi:MAG: FkbM family methyltransferase [Alphaproteobacteria bacterium]|nr:FkbM family methyltransferase [Alphaproteobacteria bacterium]
MAVGAAPGEIMVPRLDYRGDNNFGGMALGGDQGDAVEMIAIDNLLLPACHPMKVAVEGMEKQVLEGARQTISRFRPYLYVEDDRFDKHAELIATLFGLEYRLWWHLPWLYNPGNFTGDPKNFFLELPPSTLSACRENRHRRRLKAASRSRARMNLIPRRAELAHLVPSA